jgi:hypothetical protein
VPVRDMLHSNANFGSSNIDVAEPPALDDASHVCVLVHAEWRRSLRTRENLGHSNIKMTERYAKLARQHIASTSNTAREIWKLKEQENCDKANVG